MTAFTYRDGVLCAEALPLTDTAGSAGSPFSCYSTAKPEGANPAVAQAFAGPPVDSHHPPKSHPDPGGATTPPRPAPPGGPAGARARGPAETLRRRGHAGEAQGTHCASNRGGASATRRRNVPNVNLPA